MSYSDPDPELLRAENTELKRALKKSNNIIHQINNNLTTSNNIIEDLKEQNLRLKQENTGLTQKVYEIIGEKNDLQLQIDTTIRNLQTQVEEKQRELEEEKQRLAPSFDQEIYRNRLANEIEIMHRYDIEAKNLEIERLQEKLQEARREIEMNKSRMEALKLENDRDMRELKQRHKIAIDEIMLEAKGLGGNPKESKRDREGDKYLRQELDHLRDRIREKDDKISKISRERDRAFDEKHEYVKNFTEEIEKERNWKRNLLSENERLLQRIRILEEEIRFGARSQDATGFERSSLRENFGGVYPSTEFPATEMNLGSEMDQDGYIARLKNQYNELNNKYSNLQNAKAALEGNYKEEIKKLQKSTQEDSNKSRGQAESLRKELDNKNKLIATLEDTVKSLKDEDFQLNLESSQLKRKLADLEYDNTLLKQHNDLLQKQLSEKESRAKPSQATLLNENKQVPSGVQEHPRMEENIEKYKKKVTSLKQKLKLANNKIMSLLREKMQENVDNKENFPLQKPFKTPPNINIEDNLLVGKISDDLKKEIKEERANLEAMRKAVELGYAENAFNPFQGKALFNTQDKFLKPHGEDLWGKNTIMRTRGDFSGANMGEAVVIENQFRAVREDYKSATNEQLREKALALAMKLKTSSMD